MTKDFLNEIHKNYNYTPWNIENSKFDVVLHPSGGYINIVLKVKYIFPLTWRLVNPLISPDLFKKKLAEMVDNVWSGRYAISIKGNTDNRIVKVIPRVMLIESDSGQHFTINVQNMGSGQSFVEGNSCCFYSGAINYKPSALAMKIGYKIMFGEWGHDRLVYRDAKKFTEDRINRRVIYEKDKDDSPSTIMEIRNVVDRMKEHIDVWPILPIIITGYRVQAEAQLLSKSRAEKFRQKLKMSGAPNTSIEVKDGGLCREMKPMIKIEVGDCRGTFLEQANNFPIAAHEIGHMLGLSDEYNDEYNDEDNDAITINRYARKNGIEPPNFNRNTQSLMSQGDKFLPYHYITLHKSIYDIASDFNSKLGTNCSNGKPEINIVPSLLKNSNPRVDTDLNLKKLFE